MREAWYKFQACSLEIQSYTTLAFQSLPSEEKVFIVMTLLLMLLSTKFSIEVIVSTIFPDQLILTWEWIIKFSGIGLN